MSYFELGRKLPGIDPGQLGQARLRVLLAACQQHPAVEVIELRRVDQAAAYDLIVVDVGDATVAPGNPVEIHPKERLALTFRPELDPPFQVLALRKAFPSTLHLNGVPEGEPKSLCLYEDWDTAERGWTAQRFLTQILRWLEKTSDGTLHAADQSLEQVFFSAGLQLVLPHDVAKTIGNTSHELRIHPTPGSKRKSVFRGRVHAITDPPTSTAPFQVLFVPIGAVGHPPIQAAPATVGQLQAVLARAGTSLFPALSDGVRSLAANGVVPTEGAGRKRVLLLLQIPRLRNGIEDRSDLEAFCLEADLADLGIALGTLQQATPGGKAFAFHDMGVPTTDVGDGPWQDICLARLDLRYDLNRNEVRRWSGVQDGTGDFRGVLAGVGALGSMLANLWSRAAWGCWDYVDPDLVESHNIIRHLANNPDVGVPKAQAVQELTSVMLADGCNDTHALVEKANATDAPDLDALIARAKLLVDATTTLSVPRDWSMREVPRTASVFLNPTGQASILLLEDAGRTARVASLEAQYYRALLREGWGEGHLSAGTQRRTGAGCRDRSMVLAGDQVQLHAAILARQLRERSQQADAFIGVWIADEQGGVSFHSVPARASHESACEDWKVYCDEGLHEHLRRLRAQTLPNETGGILLGVSDHKQRTIHLVEALPAPLDSKASPEGFIRGKCDVEASRQACVDRTREMVNYVGEWHSHPPRASATPSDVDEALLAQLATRLAADGVPGVMLIVGEDDMSVSLRAD